MEETKSDFLKFRVTPSFKQKIEELKASIPHYKHLQLQDFVVLLIELGIEAVDEERTGQLRTEKIEKMILDLFNDFVEKMNRGKKSADPESQKRGDNSIPPDKELTG